MLVGGLPFNARERRVKRRFMASELQTVAFLLGMMIYPSLSDRCLLRQAFGDASVVVLCTRALFRRALGGHVPLTEWARMFPT